MPQLCCHDYSDPLQGLTSAEEAIIARAHSILSISNLRPNTSFNPRSYSGDRRDFVLLPQNLGPLLNLLPSKTTFVNILVRVIWAGKTLS